MKSWKSKTALIILIIVVAAAAGAFAWKASHKTPVDKAQTSISKNGQKTFCSDYGYICFDYPADWKLATSATKDEAVSPETTRIVSPSGKVVVIYRPNYGIASKTEADILSVNDLSSTKEEDLKVVSLVSQYNGAADIKLPFTPMTFVTNKPDAATGEMFTPGTTVTSDQEPVFHVFTPRNNAKINSYLYIKYDQKNPMPTEAGFFYNYDEALAELTSSEARTAKQILQSVSYKK